MYDVMAIGNALVDQEYVMSDEQLAMTNLTKGNMTLASSEEQAQLLNRFKEQKVVSAKKAGGGSAANAMYAFASLGGKPYYACRVGDDSEGRFYLHDLNEAGVATDESFAISKTGETGTCVVVVTPDGERTMQTHLGTSSEIGTKNVDFTTLEQSDWLFMEGYLAMSDNFRPLIGKLRQQAGLHHAKIAVSFADPAVVNFGKDGLLEMLGNGVDVIFCNSEEARLFTGKKQLTAAIRALMDHCDLAVVTDGANDTCICERQSDDSLEFTPITPPTVAEIIDTNGAGDNFAGAFLYALSQHYSSRECGDLAAEVASKVVRQLGPRLSPNEYRDIARQVLVV